MNSFTAVIPGRPGILKNSKQLIKRNNRIIPISSARYHSWARIALASIRAQMKKDQKPIEVPCVLVAHFYFKNHQHEPDLDNCSQGLCDLLQKAGVIANDKLIVSMMTRKIFGEPVERIRFQVGEAE